MTKEAQEALYTNTVVPLITESGFPITLTHPNKGLYNPDTGYTPTADATSTGVAIEDESLLEGLPTSLAEKVEKVILAVGINEPKASEDEITFKGKTFKVIKLEPLEPGEVVFFYTVYLGA